MAGNNKESMVEVGRVERLGRREGVSQGRTLPRFELLWMVAQGGGGRIRGRSERKNGVTKSWI